MGAGFLWHLKSAYLICSIVPLLTFSYIQSSTIAGVVRLVFVVEAFERKSTSITTVEGFD